MLDLNPPFYIYELDCISGNSEAERRYGKKPLMLFGGIERKYEPPFSVSSLTQEMSEILSHVRGSIYQAYGVYMTPRVLDQNIVSTRVAPLEAPINEKCKDRLIEKGKLVDTISRIAFSRGKDTDIVEYFNGCYVVHLMRKNLDPKLVEYLLIKIKAAMLNLACENFRISSVMSEDLLEVDAKVIPRDLYVV